jgi:FG-GAP-like repeat
MHDSKAKAKAKVNANANAKAKVKVNANAKVKVKIKPTSQLITRLCLLLFICNNSFAMGLLVEPSTVQCGIATPVLATPPAQASKRIPNSQVAHGKNDIVWAWLGTPTMRYPHKALGEITHAGSLHVLVAADNGKLLEIVHELPITRVFEDRIPRLVDLDGDGRDEIVLIESDALKGSATVVYALETSSTAKSTNKLPVLVERARSAQTGSTFRWLNLVGMADFDNDGKLDIASVITPHVGGLLTLYHYVPPKLELFAQAMDTSNHRMGDLEQQLAVIVSLAGVRPTIIVPDMQLKALHALRWESPGQWKDLADAKPLPATVQRITPMPKGGCVLLTDASWWRVSLTN